MFDIRYKPRNSIKGKKLADFVAEFTLAPGVSIRVCQVLVRTWRVFVDNASNARGSGAKIIMMSPKGLRLEKSLRLGF